MLEYLEEEQQYQTAFIIWFAGIPMNKTLTCNLHVSSFIVENVSP